MNLTFLDAWMYPGLTGVLTVLVTLLAYRVVRPLVMRVTRNAPVTSLVFERMRPALHWALPLFTLQLVWQAVSNSLVGIDGVRHWNGVLLIAALTVTAASIVRGLALSVVLRHPQDVADNLQARRILTQTRVLSRILIGVIVFAGIAFILMTFPRARQYGASLLASAGVSALVIGIAARTVFSNLLAGLQIALSQPLRIDDVLIVDGEWGRVEEITGTYVVLKIWDERRLIVPLQWFIEHPFQNWTRNTSQIIGSVFLWVDYTTDLEPLRGEAVRLAESSPDYDGRVCLLQVVDTNERAMQLRLIASSPSAGQSWDLRCVMREGMIAFLRHRQPGALPRIRAEMGGISGSGPASQPAFEPSPSKQHASSASAAEPTKEDAHTNYETDMASLTAPTGGEPPNRERPR